PGRDPHATPAVSHFLSMTCGIGTESRRRDPLRLPTAIAPNYCRDYADPARPGTTAGRKGILMQAPIADGVFAVLDCGAKLREQVDAGKSLDWNRERKHLDELLSVFTSAAKQATDFCEQGSAEEASALTRATIGLALTCWLDEWLADAGFGDANGG